MTRAETGNFFFFGLSGSFLNNKITSCFINIMCILSSGQFHIGELTLLTN